MGTRNITCAVVNGEYKVAQYGQWDGYPSGQGVTILDTLVSNDLDNLKRKIELVQHITKEELSDLWVECGANKDTSFVTMDISNKFREKYPYLSRDCGGEIFNHILNNDDGLKIDLDLEFAGDGLFCEWGYVVDFDQGTFEVYKGFNSEVLEEFERFKFLEKDGETYTPIRLVAKFPLDNLPTKEQFLDFFKSEDDEEC